MRSFTSSSEARFIAALALTFGVLMAGWEAVLRQRASATVDFAINKPPMAAKDKRGEEWVVFGNCLMMTGVSPRRLNEQLGGDQERDIINIAWHEQSPIAFFDYLRRSGHYPDVIVANVSSWLNGTNFEQEGMLVTESDPLNVAKATRGVPAAGTSKQGFSQGESNTKSFQQTTETVLSDWTSKHVLTVGHRYHLFDYSLFLGSLVTSANLDDALYQLNMQAWFRVTGSETDGQGFLGLQVQYRDDWSRGVERMADRSVQRLRLSRSLTPSYWSLLEEHLQHFRAHGTHVVLVRMPEHPHIRELNDQVYELPDRLRGLEERTGTPVLDLSRLGLAEGVHLFDAVHPDAPAADVITREIAIWLKARGMTVRGAGEPRLPGGG